MALVKTPVAGFTGLIGADQFVNGQCEVEDSKLAYYERHGYIIVRTEKEPAGVMPDESAPRAEWEAYAKAVGVNPVRKNKHELIAAVKEAMQSVSGNQG